jgi:hypothetical protein
MGCSGSRGTLNEEEKAITKGEDALGFGKVKTRTLVEQFKKYAHAETLNKNAFVLASTNAKLDIVGHDVETSLKGKFYKTISADDMFPERGLVLLAILLGNASLKDKATFLFEEFDADCSGAINKPELKAMLVAYLNMAIDKLVDLGIGDTAMGFQTADKINAYKGNLVNKIDEGVERLLKDIC